MFKLIKSIFAILIFILASCANTAESERFHPTSSNDFKYGFYVPKNTDDALLELDKALSSSFKNEIKLIQKNKDLAVYHHNLGAWLRRHWLYEGSRLNKFFQDYDIVHRDYMSGVLIDIYWRKSNGLEINLDEHIADAKSSQNAIFRPMMNACPGRSGGKFEYVLMSTLPVKDHMEFMHSGICLNTKQYWTYQSKRGWEKATKAQVDIIERLLKDREQDREVDAYDDQITGYDDAP